MDVFLFPGAAPDSSQEAAPPLRAVHQEKSVNCRWSPIFPGNSAKN